MESQGKIEETKCGLGQTPGSNRQIGVLVSASRQADDGHWPDLDRENRIGTFLA